MNENLNIEFNKQEQLLINYLKKNIENIFDDSFRNISDSNDAISFAYGWLMLAYSMEYKNIYDKLIHLKNYYKNNSSVKDFSFVINPLINIIQILKLSDEVLSSCNIKNLDPESRKFLDKLLYENFDLFLIEFYRKRSSFEQLSASEQKLIILKLINQIKYKKD